MAQQGRSEDSLVILNRPWVHALLLILVSVLAFGPGLEGELVWDDPFTVGSAAALESPLRAFSTSLFAGSSDQLAQYYRPLVTLSYWLDLQLFSSSPHIGLHFSSLLWHALAAVLVLFTLRRWISGSAPAAGETQRNVACLVAALLWATLPQKAESVAWISGRADAIGLSLLLGGLTLRARLTLPWARALAAGGGTVLALLCKESFVVAPIIVAIELWSEAPLDEGKPGLELASVARRPELLASAGAALIYIALRSAYFPIRGGNSASMAGIAVIDRLALFAETLGHFFVALLTPQQAVLLRGPIGFQSETHLLREPAMAAWGAAFLALVAILAWRVRAARPALFLLLTLLPVSNLLPSGLESRMSDRFLYVPTLALALGVAIAIVHLGAKPFRYAVLVGFVGAGLLCLRARDRAEQFSSNDALFGWERRHANRAISVLQHAASAAADAGRYREARDVRFEVVDRYAELGYGSEGYEDLVEAVRMQVAATGETHRPSMRALQTLLRALTQGSDEPVVDVRLEDDHVLGVPVSTPQALEYAARKRLLLRVWLAQLDARMSNKAALDDARAIVDECPRCESILLEASRVPLMLIEPALSLEWLARVPATTTGADDLREVALLQEAMLARKDNKLQAAALFLGQAFDMSCYAAMLIAGRKADPGSGEPPPLDPIGATACWLVGLAGVPEAFSRLDRDAQEAKAIRLRNDGIARRDLVLELIGPR